MPRENLDPTPGLLEAQKRFESLRGRDVRITHSHVDRIEGNRYETALTAEVKSVGVLYEENELQEVHLGLDTNLTFDGSPLKWVEIIPGDWVPVRGSRETPPQKGRAILTSPSGDESRVDVTLHWHL